VVVKERFERKKVFKRKWPPTVKNIERGVLPGRKRYISTKRPTTQRGGKCGCEKRGVGNNVEQLCLRGCGKSELWTKKNLSTKLKENPKQQKTKDVLNLLFDGWVG